MMELLTKYLLMKGGEMTLLQALNLVAPIAPVIAAVLKEITPQFLSIMNE